MNCIFFVHSKRYCDHMFDCSIPEKKNLFLRLCMLLLYMLLLSLLRSEEPLNVNSNNVLHSDLSS
jgi:hypothetical protein